MGKLLLGAATVMASLSLTAGVAAAQSATVDTSGPDAHVHVDLKNRHEVEVENNNKLKITNDTYQRASSGDAKVSHNTTGGTAMSGDASNMATVTARATINNGGGAGGHGGAPGAHGAPGGSGGDGNTVNVHTSAPGAKVHVDANNSEKVEITNKNDVKIENEVKQKAYSGDATVYGNTTAGNAYSGNATNNSSASFEVNVTN